MHWTTRAKVAAVLVAFVVGPVGATNYREGDGIYGVLGIKKTSPSGSQAAHNVFHYDNPRTPEYDAQTAEFQVDVEEESGDKDQYCDASTNYTWVDMEVGLDSAATEWSTTLGTVSPRYGFATTWKPNSTLSPSESVSVKVVDNWIGDSPDGNDSDENFTYSGMCTFKVGVEFQGIGDTLLLWEDSNDPNVVKTAGNFSSLAVSDSTGQWETDHARTESTYVNNGDLKWIPRASHGGSGYVDSIRGLISISGNLEVEGEMERTLSANALAQTGCAEIVYDLLGMLGDIVTGTGYVSAGIDLSQQLTEGNVAASGGVLGQAIIKYGNVYECEDIKNDVQTLVITSWGYPPFPHETENRPDVTTIGISGSPSFSRNLMPNDEGTIGSYAFQSTIQLDDDSMLMETSGSISITDSGHIRTRTFRPSFSGS